eukprot:1057727-Pleurochrysis_carterae.AAC.2
MGYADSSLAPVRVRGVMSRRSKGYNGDRSNKECLSVCGDCQYLANNNALGEIFRFATLCILKVIFVKHHHKIKMFSHTCPAVALRFSAAARHTVPTPLPKRAARTLLRFFNHAK